MLHRRKGLGQHRRHGQTRHLVRPRRCLYLLRLALGLHVLCDNLQKLVHHAGCVWTGRAVVTGHHVRLSERLRRHRQGGLGRPGLAHEDSVRATRRWTADILGVGGCGLCAQCPSRDCGQSSSGQFCQERGYFDRARCCQVDDSELPMSFARVPSSCFLVFVRKGKRI